MLDGARTAALGRKRQRTWPRQSELVAAPPHDRFDPIAEVPNPCCVAAANTSDIHAAWQLHKMIGSRRTLEAIMTDEPNDHWERVYATKNESEVSWCAVGSKIDPAQPQGVGDH